MKILLRTSIAVFSLGLGSAYAGDGDGSSATTLFTSIQNKQAVTARGVAAQTAKRERLGKKTGRPDRVG